MPPSWRGRIRRWASRRRPGTPWLLSPICHENLSSKRSAPFTKNACRSAPRLSRTEGGSARCSLPKRVPKPNGYLWVTTCDMETTRHVSSQQPFTETADERIFRSRRMRHRRLRSHRFRHRHQELPGRTNRGRLGRDLSVVLCRQEKSGRRRRRASEELQRGRKMASVRAQRRYAQGRSRSEKIPISKVRVVGTLAAPRRARHGGWKGRRS